MPRVRVTKIDDMVPGEGAVEGAVVTCPLRGSRFDIANG